MIKVYLAAPIVGVSPEVAAEVQKVKDILRSCMNVSLYDPKEHGVPNAWGMSMNEWARCIFALDVVAIDNADWIIVCDYGRKGTAGTAWEAGYAFGKGKKVFIIEMSEVDTDYSVMMRGCCTNYCSKEDFFKKGLTFKERGRMAQSEVLN